MSSLRNKPRPEDQRNVIIATVLVAIITFVWMFWLAPQPQQSGGDQAASTDTQQVEQPSPSSEQTEARPATPAPDTAQQTTEQTAAAASEVADSALVGAQEGEARIITVESNLYEAQFSTKGGTLISFKLKEYKQHDGKALVQLVDTTGRGALALAFTTPSSHLVDTRSLYFTPNVNTDTLSVQNDSTSITFEAQLGGGTIRQTYTFKPESYDVGLRVEQTHTSSFSTQEGYELIWDGGLPFSEGGTATEMQRSGVFARSGGEVESVTVSDDQHGEKRLNGDISWMAIKNKYFTAAILPDQPDQARGAELIVDQLGTRGGSEAKWKNFVARLLMPAPTQTTHTDQFHLYLGPLDYYNLASYDRNLYDMVDYGWDFFEWLTRPLAKYLFIPLFTFLHSFIPSYGIVIILLAIFVKTLVYPLTKSSYRSMAQMRELQPQLQELKEKYEDNPQKQQEEMMKLYKEAGVNPLGGCLPMLLQYPIIIALYQFLPQSVQLRHQSFLWASDLSVPDAILHLPFDIPVYGDYVAGFTLLMGLAMIVQMRVQSTPGAGGQAKMFQYLMPGVIFFIFNRFASALSLYYLVYNVVSAAQQKWINYQLEQEKDKEDAHPADRTQMQDGQQDGFFTRLLKKAEEAQKQR